MKIFSVVAFFLLLGAMPAPSNFAHQKETQKMNAPVQFIKSDTLPPSVGYSQAAVVKRGRLIYIAGQVSIDRSGKLVGPGDFRAQAEQTFENLKAALAASGATFDDVVKLNSYFVDIKQAPL
jgi:enamine deaminase RidA (YjgF/YER057c/UK114 family)